MNEDAFETGGTPEHFPPLSPAELNILLSLAGREELHGYGIMKEVEKHTPATRVWGPARSTAR